MKWNFILCGLLAAGPALAQNSESQDTETTTVTIVSTRLKPAVPWSERRTKREGESVADVLEKVPGLTVLDGGVAGSRAELYVRGADANFTAILIEGVPVNDLSDARGGAYDMSTVAGDELKAATVGQGPLSALYGSGALAGVVNFELDLPSDNHFRIAASGDEEYAVRLGGSVPVASGWSLAGAVRHGEDGDHDLGQWRTLSSATARLSGDLSGQGRLSVLVRAAESDREGFDVASGGILYAETDERQLISDKDRLLGVAYQHQLDTDSSLNLNLSGFRRDEDQYTPAIPDGVYSGTPATIQTSRFDRVQATALYRRSGNKVDYTGGVELMRETGTVDGVLDFGGGFALPTSFEQQRDSAGVFGEAQVRYDNGLTLRGGARVDGRDKDKAAWSTRATAEWRSPGNAVVLAGTWGQAVKVPSFYALGDPLVGSADLRNEESDGTELRVSYGFGQMRLTAVAHRTVYRNLIDFDFATFKLVNRDKVEINGTDLSLTGPVTQKLGFEARLSTLNNSVNGVEDGLLHRPDLTAALDLTWSPVSAVTLRLDNRYVGERASSSIPTGDQTLKAYLRSDLSASYRFDSGLSVNVRLGNLWDEDYETISGFRARGRTIMVSLLGSF